jgi:hypothetical protein
MFCPLCRAEYRDGFSSCGDCHIPLVATLAEAQAKSTKLWKGEDSRRLDELLSALDAADIPRYYKEELSPVPRIKIFRPAPVRPVTTFELWVLNADLARAETAIRQQEAHEDGTT